MKKITEENLLDLGFERHDVGIEESGDKSFYYFTFEIGSLCLLSNSDDECIDGMYAIEFLDYSDAVRFNDIKTLTDLVKLLLANKI